MGALAVFHFNFSTSPDNGSAILLMIAVMVPMRPNRSARANTESAPNLSSCATTESASPSVGVATTRTIAVITRTS